MIQFGTGKVDFAGVFAHAEGRRLRWADHGRVLQGRRNRRRDDGECAGQSRVPRERPGAGVGRRTMAAFSRREFFKKTATDAAVAGFLAASAAELRANPLGLPIGSQTYPHRAHDQGWQFCRPAEDARRHRRSGGSSCARRSATPSSPACPMGSRSGRSSPITVSSVRALTSA